MRWWTRVGRSGVRRLAEQLCTEGLAHVVASDGHRATSWRPVTKLAAGLEALTALVGAERARWMAAGAPRAIVEGMKLPAGASRDRTGTETVAVRRRVISRFFVSCDGNGA